MKPFAIIMTLIMLFTVSTPLLAIELVVVVHKDNPVSELSRKQILDIYMGRKKSFPSGEAAKAVDLPDDSIDAETFYANVVGKSVAEVNAYWARLLFTGRATPPESLTDQSAVLNYFKTHKNTIAYIRPDQVNDQVKVVYRVK